MTTLSLYPRHQLRSVGNTNLIHTEPWVLTQRRWTGGPWMTHIPNRIDLNGRNAYRFDGREVSLEDHVRQQGDKPLVRGFTDDKPWLYNKPSEAGNALTAQATYRMERESPEYRYFPYANTFTVRYQVRSTGLQMHYTVMNHEAYDMPFGLAFHPYFRVIGQTNVRIPAKHVMEVDERLLPTGKLLDV